MSSRSFWEHWNFGNNSALPINQSIMQLCPEILAMANLQKITLANFRQIRHFRQNCLFQGHLCHLICLENYTLANFCHIRHIFVELAIIVKTATLDGAPLPYHLTCSYYYGEFLPFHSFRQICHFRQNRQSQMGPLIIFNFTCPKGFGEVSPYSPFSSWTRLSNFSYRRRLDQLIQLYISLSYTGLLKTATALFVFYPKCQPLLKPRASAKSFSQKLTHFPGKVLHLALFRNKTWVHWSLQEWPISFM